MPAKWDFEMKYTLLLKLLQQNESCLSGYNKDTMLATWPNDNKPTVHTIPKLVSIIRKDMAAASGNSSIPSTPSRTKFAPVTPSSRLSKLSTTSSGPNITPSKRPGPPLARRKSAAKKRRTHNDESDEGTDIKSSEEDTNGNETSNDESDLPMSDVPKVTPVRQRRARTIKSRSKSYTYDADSAGEDAGAQSVGSEDDFELTERKARKMKRGHVVLTKPVVKNSPINGTGEAAIKDEDEDEDEQEEEEDERMHVESDAESKTTWKSAVEDADDLT